MGNSDDQMEREKKEKRYGNEYRTDELKEKRGREEWKETMDREKDRKDRENAAERQRLAEEQEKRDERMRREKEKKDRENAMERQRLDEEQEKRDERMRREKEKKDRENAMERQRLDEEQEKREERMRREKEKKDRENAMEREKMAEEKKHKEKKDEHGHDYHGKDEEDQLSNPSGSGVNVSSGPAYEHGGKAVNHHNLSSAPPQPTHLSQSEEIPCQFLREPGNKPARNQCPLTEPDIESPPPQYSFYPPSQPQPFQAAGDVGGVRSAQDVPPSGYRILLGQNVQFPPLDRLGLPPAFNSDSSTPVFIGSAIFPNSVHPCRIVPSLNSPCRVLFGGSEVEHHERYDLLPVTQDMEWIPTKGGEIPPGRRPVEAGYESNGNKLYHALGLIQGIYVPGKAGQHLVSGPGLFTLRKS